MYRDVEYCLWYPMAGRMDIGFPNRSLGNMKEQLVRRTLCNVRAQGHPYVELREDGKKLIFFCTLCRAPCYGDSSLLNHLNGNLHTRRLQTAKATLLKPNPWPFSDGVFFFCDDLVDQNKHLLVSNYKRSRLLDDRHHVNDAAAIVRYGKNLCQNSRPNHSQEIDDCGDCDEITCDRDLDGSRCCHELVIPSVLQNNEVSNLVVRHMGVGNIGARFSKKDGVSEEIHRIWCEWLGDKDSTCEDVREVPEHDFAVVTFSYDYDLGRKGLLDGFGRMLPSTPHSEADNSFCSRGKKRRSFSDPMGRSSQYDSSEEESQASNNSDTKMILLRNDNQLVHSQVLSSKTMRKEVRDQERIAAERSCDICRQRMLPDKDVAAILNRKTGKFVCSSRNLTGAFHVFHVSCLLSWILLCEVEIYEKQSVAPKAKRKSRRKVKDKDGRTRVNWETLATRNEIKSAFCPECQGTGMETVGEELEKPSVQLSKIFNCKIKLCDAQKEWMKNPEMLQNCSMGFYFPLSSNEMCEESVSTLKLLHFYRAGT